MNKSLGKIYLFVFLISFVCLVTGQVSAIEIVIDPGHDGNEQNRGGPAFEVNSIGDDLSEVASIGDTFITVKNSDHFSSDNGYDSITIGNEQFLVLSVDHNSNQVFIFPEISTQYNAGTSVTVKDFLVQAMGRKNTGTENDWDPDDTDFDQIQYTHEIHADSWDQWQRKESSEGHALGTLEFLNTYRIAKQLESELESVATVHLTKSDTYESVSRSDRALMHASERPDVFLGVHTNAPGKSGVAEMDVYGPLYVPFKNYPYTEQTEAVPSHTSPGYATDHYAPSHTRLTIRKYALDILLDR